METQSNSIVDLVETKATYLCKILGARTEEEKAMPVYSPPGQPDIIVTTQQGTCPVIHVVWNDATPISDTSPAQAFDNMMAWLDSNRSKFSVEVI